MNPKILLVEDDELNRDMLSRRLELEGFTVIQAENGLEGLRLAEKEAPGLILMDMSLPDLDGWEATRRLKLNESTRFIPVIALTAHAMVGDREGALRAGCDEFESKPIHWERLMAKMALLLQPEVP